MNTDNNFQWTDELVKEYCAHLIVGKSCGVTNADEHLNSFKHSKLQSQDKQVGWEIMAFTTPFLGNNGVLFSKNEDGYFGPKNMNVTQDFLLKQKDAKIHSVKRLSDGEVFTVGDKIKDDGGIISIEKFEIEHAFVNLLKICFNEGGFLQIDKCPAPSKSQPSLIDRIEVDKQKIFKSVLNTLKKNKVMVDTKEDGIYIRLAGKETEGEAFTLHWGLVYPFNTENGEK